MTQDVFDQQIEFARRQLEILRQHLRGSAAEPLSVEALQGLASSLEVLLLAANTGHGQGNAAARDRTVEVDRRRHRDLFESAADGYLMTSLDGVIQEANRAAAALLGVDQTSVAGEPLYTFVAGQNREAFCAELARLPARDGAISDWIAELQSRTGNTFLAELTVGAVQDHAGQPIGLRWLLRDVTPRRRAEEALRESEERFRGIFEQAAVGICHADLDGKFIRANQKFCDIVGYTQVELSQLTFREITHPDDLGIDLSHVQRLLGGELQTYTLGKRYYRKDGSIIWVNLTASLARDASGAPGYFIGVIEDITERKHAEEALKSEHDFASAVVDTVGALVVVLDREGRIVRFNKACELTTGYVSEEIESKHVWDLLLTPEEIEPVKQVFRDLRSGPFPQKHANYWVARDGKRRLIDWNNTVLLDSQGAVEYVIGTGIDITERRQAEEALRQRNHEMALLNSAVQTLTSTLDLHRVVFNIMEELARFLDAENCSVWLIDPATGESVCHESTGPNREVVRGWRLAPDQGVVGWVARHGKGLVVPDTRLEEQHYKVVDDTTGVETHSILCVPLWVRPGVIGVLEVTDTEVNHFTDADLRKVEPLAATAATAIVNARLYERAQQELADRKRAEEALRRHAAELQTRNEELDAFAHTVAHDLKNPLSIIVGFAESLESDYAFLPSEVLSHHLHSIAESARKMANITDELLLLAGVRKLKVRVEPLDMAGIVREAHGRLTTAIAAAHAEIIFPDAWPAAAGHAPWVEQVWVNYISNAIQYGGQPPHLELGATVQSPGVVRFWVRDNGHGLTPEDQARLFTPFTRLEQVRAKGHGLGLSIVRRIVEKLGGQVGVESQIGEGSTFFFTLPGVAD